LEKVLPQIAAPEQPFALEKAGLGPVRFLTAGQMSAGDRALAVNAQAEIDRQARRAGIDPSRGSWTTSQVVCPALPQHLFLRFQRMGRMGERTIFSAAILRGSGRAELIPLVANNHALLWPAPVGTATIAAFNRIRGEEPSGEKSDWLGTALCYAALDGAELGTAAPEQAPPAVLEARSGGGAVVRFTDAGALPQPLVWSLSFDIKGELLKVAQEPATLVRQKQSHPDPVDERGKEIHPAAAP
jgi:hypothetical protein